LATGPAAAIPSPPPARPPVRPEIPAPSLPTGTVTFLLSDIEGSTALWEKAGQAFRSALATHHALMRAEFRRNGGQEVKEAGDSFLVAFAGASDALSCVIACQKALAAQPWPETVGRLNVRMALHTGDVEMEDGEYHGLMLHHAARILEAGHGGQTLVSEATAALLRRDLALGVHLKDLGVWRLRDVEEPERLFQVESSQREPGAFPPLNAAPAHSAHLPLQFTRFFGRTAEIARIIELLQSPETRLLILTGAGGTGKSRLAIQTAERLAESFQGEIWFIPLADLSDPGLIAGEIVDALGIPRSGQVEPLEQAVSALAKQPSLLILDNFEHLIGVESRDVIPAKAGTRVESKDGAQVVQALLERVPSLTMLVTSRQRLNLPGEREFAVPPLPTPNGPNSPERLSMFESVQLFVDRAQASKPDFRVTNSNAAAIAELCDRLEGMPLAIELAAARALVMTPAQMLQESAKRFDFLVGRKRGVVERHRTLRAAVDWSYRLLAPEMQRFFARLSVFRGGWTVEAAEAVCEEPLALDLLALLRECSLVLTEETEQGMRFRMLETMREYAQERLVEAAEVEVCNKRHTDYFLSLAEQAEPELKGADQAEWLARLETEHDNLRAALAWCRDADDGGESGLRLAGALWQFWLVRGHWSEGREWLAFALGHLGAHERTKARAKALNCAGELARSQADYAPARSACEESLAISRELGDRHGVANSLHTLGNLARNQGNYAQARSFYEESMAIRRELGDRLYIAASLESLANVAFLQERRERATRLLGAVDALRESIGAPLSSDTREDYVSAASAALGEVAFTAAWEAGRAMTWEEAIACALEVNGE
jgi:predicted ATPase/class 3 adenylate cyclase